MVDKSSSVLLVKQNSHKITRTYRGGTGGGGATLLKLKPSLKKISSFDQSLGRNVNVIGLPVEPKTTTGRRLSFSDENGGNLAMVSCLLLITTS